MQTTSLFITEIFKSLQGESTQAGRPCTFVRLTGCPLRCTWCDTEYAFTGGQSMTISEIMARVRDLQCDLVEVTGGEPLAQKNAPELLAELVTQGFEVMLETSGAFDVRPVPNAVKIIMDIKAPGSGEAHRNLWSNLDNLKSGVDEIKIVVADRADFDFAVRVTEEKKLFEHFTVLISPVTTKLDYSTVADWILETNKPFRFQAQMHKIIWPHKEQGF